MTASRQELLELAETLERALDTPSLELPPTVDAEWRTRWPALAELGLPAFCVPEEVGGLGNEVAAALVASRSLGAALHGSPYPGIAAAAFAISRWLEPGERETVVEAVASGDQVPTIAFLESSSKGSAERNDSRVDGCARLVLGAAQSDSFLVVQTGSPAMVFVRAGDGCFVETSHPFDVTRSVADVTFDGARGSLVESDWSGRSATDRLYGLLLAGDALGGVERMLERTRAHALEREAFGRPIGGFQAVQHRLVDHAVRVRGMALLASRAADCMLRQSDDAERSTLLAEAAVAAGAVHVLHDLLQLTGAIGFTWEHGLHLYERRAHLDARLGRNPRSALRSLATLQGWMADDGRAPGFTELFREEISL